jgi:probable F420-dependent oxidoreductase
MKIGVQLWPQATTVKEMRTAWRTADAMGVDSIWTWDHFYPVVGNPEATHFECYSLLAAMAADTCHAQIGALVTCFTYRNPQLLADMARTIDHISEGRFVLGLGSGWFERDYTEYGYEFGTAVGRLKLLEAGLPVIKDRMSKLNPQPVNGNIPIMIGGNGEKITLRLVAEYANQCNFFDIPKNCFDKNKILDDWCARVNRNPKDIERTACVHPKEVTRKVIYEYQNAGIEHLILYCEDPFDFSGIKKILSWTKQLFG